MWEQVIGTVTKIVAVVGPSVAFIIRFFEKHKEEIQVIILRVQKDAASQGEWTNEEKEELVIDIYFKEVRPYLPWYVRMVIGKGFARRIIRKVIKWATEQSHNLKEKSKVIESAVKNGA